MFEKLKIGESFKETRKFTPIHPNPDIGKKHGISLFLYGKHSEQYRNATAVTMRKNKANMSLDERVEVSAQQIIACCTGWEGVTEKDEKTEQTYNRGMLLKILTDDDFRWFRLQAEMFQLEDDNYF